MKKIDFDFDFKSIRFKLWMYFILFAVILVGLIWLLQVYFLDAYYEDMKLKETSAAAFRVMRAFENATDIDDIKSEINDIGTSSDTYIRVETGDGRILLTPMYNGLMQLTLYNTQASQLRNLLNESELPSVSRVSENSNRSKTLSYATYLYKAFDRTGQVDPSNSIVLYMFSPLYPVKSTVSILRTQLIYITAISLILAFSLALYLSGRISHPIRSITDSAAEMGRGNYGVQFRGGQFSEINDLADTLTNASRELEKTDMYQKDLIANVSHDLRTPLTMIKSYAEMIRDLSGDNPEKREKHLSVIIEETDRLNNLVTDMLNMSRMQQRKIVLERTDFDLDETVRTTLSSYEILAEQEGYLFSYSGVGKVMVNGDEAKIKQVITNLINNAVKYCGEDKVIQVSLRRIRGKVRCEVTDHGQGIAPDEINHVWERYYKSSTHHVRQTEGSGLGLSIVREILSLHKAGYGVESELNEGSTFWFEMDVLKTKPQKKQN